MLLADEKYFDQSIFNFQLRFNIFLSEAASDIPSQALRARRDRGAGRNIAIQKISRPFRGSFTE
jgi:hypothetical protein